MRSWLLPARIVAVTVLGSIPVKLARDPLADPDLWWHLRTGKLIVTGGIPTTDPYSFTKAGEAWVVQEWGSEVLLHALRSWFGLAGIIAYRSIAMLLLYAIVARLLVRRMGSGMGTWALLGLAAYAGSANWTERPNLLSFILLAVTLDLLDRKDKRLWWFIPLAIVWANLHGMVLLGVGTVGVVAVAEWLKVALGQDQADRSWARRTTVVTLAGVAATMLNPAGPRLITHALSLVGTVRGIVTEWASPDFHEASSLVFLGLVLLTIVALALDPKQPDLTDLALASAYIVLALQAVRNLSVAAIVLALVASRSLPRAVAALRRRGAAAGPEVTPSVPLGILGWVMVVAGLTGLLIEGLPRSTDIRELSPTYPVAAIDDLRRPGVRIFVRDNWSGMVIDRAWPQARVYVDLRADYYGRAIVNRYRRAIAGLQGWDRTLDDSCANHVLVRPSDPIAERLADQPGWRERRRDRLSVTYERTGTCPEV